MTGPRVLFRNSGVFGKFSILGMSLLRGARGRLEPPRSLLLSFFILHSFSSILSFPFFDLPAWEVWSLAVVGTQHSGLREDNNKINSLFNHLLSHAPTAV